MRAAQRIVNHLLEALDPSDYLLQDSPKPEDITRENAVTAGTFYHRTRKYARSNRPLEARRNGRTQTWVRQPEKFRIPVKYGMYDAFSIDNRNAHEWAVLPPP